MATAEQLAPRLSAATSRRIQSVDIVRGAAMILMAIDHIRDRVLVSNAESIALSKRLEFKHEGIHRNEFRCGRGKLHDVHCFALTDADYLSTR